VVAVSESGEIVAHFAALCVDVQVDGRRRMIGQLVDAYARRRADIIDGAVYVKLVREFYRRHGSSTDLQLLFGFPGQRHMRLGRHRLKFANPVLVPVWRRPAEQRRFWWPSQVHVEPTAAVQALDQLWQRAAWRYPVAAIRNGTWLERRFLRRPDNRYVHFTASLKTEIQAWGVLHVAGEVGQWADLVWDGRNDRVLAALDEAVARSAQASGANRLELWLSGDREAERILETRGWIRGAHPAQLQMTALSFDPGLSHDNFLDRFYLTTADSDLV
jgi:hypothetical protein